MKTFFKILSGIVLLGVIGYTMYFLYQKSQVQPIVYETDSPVVIDIIKKTTATGSVVPRKEIEIKPVVSGIVDELFVEEGEMIKKGDLIARIRIIPNMINLNNAKSRIEVAKINLKDAKRNYDRQLGLLEKGVIAKADFESYETAFKNAQEELETAQETLELIEEGQTKNAGGQTNTLVKSTIEGMILDLPVEVGYQVIEANNFNAGTTIATIADMGAMVFEGNIDETEVGKIKEGLPLEIIVGAIENATFNAILDYIAPKGKLENGAIQFEIKATLKKQDSIFIRAGLSANASIILAKVDSVLAIKEALVQFDSKTKKPFVEIKTGEKAFERKDIVLGVSDGIQVQIKEGITFDDEIKVWNEIKKSGN